MENRRIVEQIKTVIRMKIPHQVMMMIIIEILEHGPGILDKM